MLHLAYVVEIKEKIIHQKTIRCDNDRRWFSVYLTSNNALIVAVAICKSLSSHK